ncbi:sensor domain-containing protein [Candidatus Mycobacterium wuenschmannii]|uniref:Sensor domain-containing protein n=1 Tax=Candidatus Mycobacterium wuenschmannii TaxID=3027808 RepID=A0ABY8VY53_9MYCO|nr:sensor domain-containing protein [Candidatus Mycobacterium wuenschmannii]WIM88564.1 sensor domain-containing protein [Candidatus Mycobacterium wuenschmannii]
MLFVSYASQDRALIEPLLTSLRRARQQVWWDDKLGGGEAWWHAILEQIRRSEVFIVAVSNNSLASKPCQAELNYAEALRRPILPVQIGPVDSLRVTPLAARQILDFRQPDKQSTLRLLSSVQQRQSQIPPLPWPQPPEPPVPFAYLMRLAAALSRPELSRHQQTELITELKDRLDDDRHDPTAFRDITQLLCQLRDRPDVTWRIRTEIDATLAAMEAGPATSSVTVPFNTAHTSGPMTVPTMSAPQAMATADPAALQSVPSLPSFPAQPMPPGPPAPLPPAPVPPPPSGMTRPPSRRRWIFAAIAGVVVAVVAGVALKVVLTKPAANPLDAMLLNDTEINAVMGASDMKTVERGNQAMKQSSTIDVSAADCMGALYPGLTSTYQDSGELGLAWRTLQKPGGLPRAGESKNQFVDQDVAIFPANSDQPFNFVAKAADQWKACSGKTATVTYTDRRKYTWTINSPTGEAPKVLLTYTKVGDPGYTCQRALSTVSNYVVDVKACGFEITDQANRIVDQIVGAVKDPNGTK